MIERRCAKKKKRSAGKVDLFELIALQMKRMMKAMLWNERRRRWGDLIDIIIARMREFAIRGSPKRLISREIDPRLGWG